MLQVISEGSDGFVQAHNHKESCNEHKLQAGLNRIAKGKYAEDAASRYIVKELGWDIVDRNWRCKAGEIDLVARDGEWLVFIEVRSRSAAGSRFGSAREAISPRKQHQVRKLAELYMYSKRLTEVRIRCDAIVVTLESTVNKVDYSYHLEHIRQAF